MKYVDDKDPSLLKAKSIISKAFETNPDSIAEAQSRLLPLIFEALDAQESRIGSRQAEVDTLSNIISQSVLLVQKSELLNDGVSIFPEGIIQLIEKAKAGKNLAANVIHHHWYTPTHVEQVGEVMNAVPKSPEPSSFDVKQSILNLTDNSPAMIAKLSETLQSNAFRTAMDKMGSGK